MQIVVTCRAIIIHEGKLLMCRHPTANFLCLPGGKLEPGETIEAGMARELVEETGIKPQVAKLLFINQFIDAHNHRVEFFFRIDNPAAYANFDPTAASHGFEIAQFILADATAPDCDLRPSFLRDRFPELIAQDNQFATEVIRSH